MEDDDDQSTCIEPVISYFSPSTNRGVKEISNTKFNLIKNNSSVFSSHNLANSSVYNTIMLPFISSDGSIRTENSNKNMNKSIPTTKENSSNNYYMKFDNTRNKTLSSKSDGEQKNNENLDLKINNTYNEVSSNILKKTTYIPKRLSMNLPETNYQEILNCKNNNTEHNYESDDIHDYNKKYTKDIKDSIRTTKNRHIQPMEERIPSLFLKAEKRDKNTNKNIIVFKTKKRRKTQKIISKANKIAFKKKDKIDMIFIEKSKSYDNESLARHCQSSHKKDKIEKINNKELNEVKFQKQICKSNTSLKNLKENINNEETIKKILTNKPGANDKLKTNIKTEKKKKKKTDKNERKISFKENNITNKLVKLMFNRNNEIKNNKYESSGLKLLRDHINNRHYKEKKEEEKNKYKSRKILKKSTNSKDKGKEKNEEKDSQNQEDRRQSGFLSKEEVIKKIFERPNKDKKISKKDKSKYNDIIINNDSKKEINKLKPNDGHKNDSTNNILITVSRRKRSISLHYQPDKMHQISEALKAKIPKKLLNLNNASSSTIITKKKKKKKLSDVEVLLKKNFKDEQYNLFSKFTNTVYTGPDFSKYIINCVELIMDMDKDSQVRLKTKINFNFPKSKKKAFKKRIALFDLDETLVHCTGDIKSGKNNNYQHVIDITLPGKNTVKVGINLRPLWKETLDLIKRKYHIVIHTASHQAYADSVLDFMDPEKKYFKYRLYRNNCSLVDIDGVKFYVKDLDIFDEYYDLKDIVIIDNSVLSFAYHLYNGIPIVPYYEGDQDNFLYVVGLYLEHIYKAFDLREANKRLINLDYFFEIAKSQMENADSIIDEESKVTEEEEEINKGVIEKGNISLNRGDETEKTKKSRHKSGKSTYSNKKRLGSHSPLSARRTTKEISDIKIKTNSNLFNMYLELNENKKMLRNKYSLTTKETKKEKSLSIANFSNYAKLVKDDINAINKEDENKVIECKSLPDLNHPHFAYEYFSDDDISVKNMKKLRRGMSLVDGEYLAQKIKDAIMGNLKIIKNNFSNKFQAFENMDDND